MFPTDPEWADAFNRLNTKYHDDLGRTPVTFPVYIDEIGLSLWTYQYGRLRVDEGLPHDQAWDQINRTINDIAGIGNGGGNGGGATGTFKGGLRQDGRRLRDKDGATFRWIGATSFRLLHMVANGEDPRPVMRELVGEGFNLARTLTTAVHLFDLPAAKGLAALPTLLAIGQEEGIGFELVALADTKGWSRQQIADHLQAVYQIAESFDWGVVEGGNEIGPVHGTQSGEVVDVCRSFTSRALPYCPGSVHGGEFCKDPKALTAGELKRGQTEGVWPFWDEVSTYGRAFGTSHLKRGDDRANRIRHVRELELSSNNAKCYFVDDEPQGAAEANVPGRRDASPSAFFGQGVLAQVFGLGATFHSECGLRSERLQPVQMACAKAFIRGCNIVGGAEISFQNSGWGTSPIDSFTNAVRVYSGVAAQSIACVVGNQPGTTIKTKNGWRLGDVKDREGEFVVYELLR